jgi:hypothetical protein|tara:strand:- start:342 stop:722 length:381 start_codon:yes stop_codon:yes gene_type:complete
MNCRENTMNTLTVSNVNEYTVEDITNILAEATQEARDAAVQHLSLHGEQAYCGFAWVNIWKIKGNTKLGKRMKSAGLSKDYSGAYNIWNPSTLGTQCMSTKEAGARACASVFKKYGFECSAGSRAD